MEIILQGAPGKVKRSNILAFITTVFFIIVPILTGLAAIIMLIIHCFRLNDNILVALFELIGDVFHTRVGWFFENGATFQSVFQENPLEYVFRFTGITIVLFMGNIMEDWKCPYCGHFFTGKRISGDSYKGTTERQVSNTYYDYEDGVAMDMTGNLYLTQTRTKNKQYGTETTDHYTHNAKCSCCGCVYKRETTKQQTNWD